MYGGLDGSYWEGREERLDMMSTGSDLVELNPRLVTTTLSYPGLVTP